MKKAILDIDAAVLDIARYTKRFNEDMAAKKAAYNPDTIKVGDIIEFWHRPYQHCACIEITKVNKKSLKGVEINNSYKPGMEWAVGKDYEEIRISNQKPLTAEELAERDTLRKREDFSHA